MLTAPVHSDLILSDAGLDPTYLVTAVDEYGETSERSVAGERPLTLYVDKKEILTLMTLGTHPESLVLGYLRNQGFIRELSDIASVQVDWETDSVAVTTRCGIDNLDTRLSKRTVTTGCGQGTVFGDMMDELSNIRLPRVELTQSGIYALLKNLNEYNDIYRKAGAVHGCALCQREKPLFFIEDVGRHNAVDAIAGMMWLNDMRGDDKVFYTTGRLTSEMVIKVAKMNIPVLLSRSGITQMGLSLAQQLGVTLIARAKGQHFLVYNGADNIIFDARPAVRNKLEKITP